MEVGIHGPTGYSLLFNNAIDINAYLPALGPAGQLTSDFVNPTSTMAGAFGGQLTALRLNVDFSDAGVTLGTRGLPFGELIIRNIDDYPPTNGLSVRQFLHEASNVLGGGSSVIQDITKLTLIAIELNSSFDSGVASSWAQDHFRLPSNIGDFITYQQVSWGATTTTDATNLLQNHYAAVSVFGSLGIGSGKSIVFTSADAVRNFLPQSGTAGQLTDNLVFNPLTTPAGSLAGEVLALRLNIGFSDTGYLGDAGILFGDLRITNVPELGPGLNLAGVTVRELYDITNSVLGGQSPGAYFTTLASLNSVTAELNRSFGGGYVTDWALAHLRLPGDFNADGTVDGADYVTWRDGLGTQYTQSHSQAWRSTFGMRFSFGVSGAGSGTGSASAIPAVPEPANWLSVLIVSVIFRFLDRTARSRRIHGKSRSSTIRGKSPWTALNNRRPDRSSPSIHRNFRGAVGKSTPPLDDDRLHRFNALEPGLWRPPIRPVLRLKA
jgi:hypothetical protein